MSMLISVTSQNEKVALKVRHDPPLYSAQLQSKRLQLVAEGQVEAGAVLDRNTI